MRQVDHHVLDRALLRWRELWDSHTSHMDGDEMMKLGFYRNALEYWCLAKLFVGILVRTQMRNTGSNTGIASGNPLGRFDTDDMIHVNHMLRQLCVRDT